MATVSPPTPPKPPAATQIGSDLDTVGKKKITVDIWVVAAIAVAANVAGVLLRV